MSLSLRGGAQLSAPLAAGSDLQLAHAAEGLWAALFNSCQPKIS